MEEREIKAVIVPDYEIEVVKSNGQPVQLDFGEIYVPDDTLYVAFNILIGNNLSTVRYFLGDVMSFINAKISGVSPKDYYDGFYKKEKVSDAKPHTELAVSELVINDRGTKIGFIIGKNDKVFSRDNIEEFRSEVIKFKRNLEAYIETTGAIEDSIKFK